MSDRIVVMNNGVAEQIGNPFEIYSKPATRFVASFVGHLNMLEARLVDPGTGAVEIDGQPIALNRPIDGPVGRMVSLALRPEAIQLGAQPGNDAVIRGPVKDVSFLGSVVRIRVDAGRGADFTRYLQQHLRPAAGGGGCGRDRVWGFGRSGHRLM